MFDLGLDKYRELQVLAQCPSTYAASLFFTRYNRAFLPPHFADTAEKISKKTRTNFTQLWAWEFERLMKSLGIPEEVGDVSSYTQGGRSKGNLPGASSRVSEVFKSAFVRCVAWFHLQKILSKEECLEYSMTVCPIDVSLWDIKTGAPPDWWPRSGVQSKEISTLPEWNQCCQLSDLNVNRYKILAAEGAVIPATEQLRSHFSLIPFAYSIHGPVGDVCKKIHRSLKQTFWMKYPVSEHLIAVFDGPNVDDWVPLYDPSDTFDGLEVYPLVAGMRFLHINVWQYWRGIHPPLFPTPHLFAQKGSVGHDAESWYYEKNGQRVFEGRDWRIGNIERTDEKEYQLTGQYALCDSEWVDEFLEKYGLRLAYVLHMSVLQRNREYEDPKESRSCALLNLSSIVT
jgi:hypothetical protein